MKRYNFELTIKKYKRSNGCLEDIRAVYINGICIVAKNLKHGGFYFSSYIAKRDGKFFHVAGSVQYPILFPKTDEVVLKIEGFPQNPKKLFLSPELYIEDVYRTGVVTISNVKEVNYD